MLRHALACQLLPRTSERGLNLLSYVMDEASLPSNPELGRRSARERIFLDAKSFSAAQ